VEEGVLQQEEEQEVFQPQVQEEQELQIVFLDVQLHMLEEEVVEHKDQQL
jgi:ribosomal protein L25 (general stress protein Ctc)